MTAAWLGKMNAHILQANGHWDEQQQQPPPTRHQPMLLTAWTQTSGEDFEMLRTLDVDPQLQAENRALRDKVRYLESKLQEHSDLLSQIHATSARRGVKEEHTPPEILTPPNSVICAPQQQSRAEIIDYKIIAAAGADCNDADAIEIRLAAESLNSLSTSADSDRLEICLNGEEQQQQQQHNQQIKREWSNTLQPSKRCKLDEQQQQRYTLPLATPPPLSAHNNNNNNNYKTPRRRSTPKLKPETQLSTTNGDNVMVSIGPNNTCVPSTVFENINWSVSSLATRKLLVAIFDRETLATHSMTGKPSPAFKDQHKPLKQMLDPLKIQDIIFAVTHKSNASEKEVRNAITTKCADENKMMKIQKGKLCSVGGDKENQL